MTTATATPKQIAFITTLLAQRAHTTTAKTITIGDTTVRASVDALDKISRTVASKLITALKAAPLSQPHFTRNDLGNWCVTGGPDTWTNGDTVEVTTRNGETKRVILTHESTRGMWLFRDANVFTGREAARVLDEAVPTPARRD